MQLFYLKQLRDLPPGRVIGNACRRYSCCCLFCNCCVFEFVSLEVAPRFVARRVVGNACRIYSCCCIFCNCCVFAFAFRFCKSSTALIRSLHFSSFNPMTLYEFTFFFSCYIGHYIDQL